MSAIWGVIDFNQDLLNTLLEDKMEKPFHKYKIDQFQKASYENVIMGCGLQYITKESTHEILPIFDYENNIYMTADCILDNREELLDALGDANHYNLNTPDGTLIYGAYLKWGESCAKHLRGIFSFAIYDKNENKLLVYADQVFERCIYYYFDGQMGYFSTLIAPILAAGEKPFKINEEFICDSLALESLRASIEDNYTPYEGILKVNAGSYIKMTLNKCETIRYWSPTDNKNYPPYESPEKSGQYLKGLMEAAVEDALRCNGEIGAALSSGLDSSTVCGIAATKLKQQNRMLNSYTFVPASDYVYTGDHYWIPDETKGVQCITAMHENIKPHFLINGERDTLKDLEQFVALLEIPYKAVVNLPSISNVFSQAHCNQCKVLLIGQHGNVTISQGRFSDALYDYIRRFKIKKAYSMINDFNKRFGLARKRLVKHMLLEFIKHSFHKFHHHFSGKILDNSYVNKTFARNMHVTKKIRQLYYNMSGSFFSNINAYHTYMHEMNSLLQVGEMNTKIALANGLVVRDPTKDIRIIEYCASLPMECFVHDGLERWLVRGNMAEYVPKEILYNVKQKGLQGADYQYQINKHWAEILPKIYQHCLSPSVLPYIDAKKVKDFLALYENGFKDNNNNLINPLLYIITINLFLNSKENKLSL
jgi:asparagine synthase (glutamine-hydrolysing)